MHISLKSDIKKMAKSLNGFSDQIPFATAQALNATAYDARTGTQDQMEKDLDKPTPFTLRSVRYRKANKRALKAILEITPEAWDYLAYQAEGGTRKPKNRAIAIGVNARRNKYGNVAKGSIKRLLARSDTFSGTIKGVSGIWQRMKHGRIKLLHYYTSQADYKGKRFRYYSNVQGIVEKKFRVHFSKHIKLAIRSARL